MMNASAMSKAIRDKKKKLEDEAGAVKLSGIPEDAQDIDSLKRREATNDLDENVPTDHEEDPSLSSERAEEMKPDPAVKEVSDDPHQINQPEDGEKEQRQAKIRKSYAKAMNK
jgi:hypothetical protein